MTTKSFQLLFIINQIKQESSQVLVCMRKGSMIVEERIVERQDLHNFSQIDIKRAARYLTRAKYQIALSVKVETKIEQMCKTTIKKIDTNLSSSIPECEPCKSASSTINEELCVHLQSSFSAIANVISRGFPICVQDLVKFF